MNSKGDTCQAQQWNQRLLPRVASAFSWLASCSGRALHNQVSERHPCSAQFCVSPSVELLGAHWAQWHNPCWADFFFFPLLLLFFMHVTREEKLDRYTSCCHSHVEVPALKKGGLWCWNTGAALSRWQVVAGHICCEKLNESVPVTSLALSSSCTERHCWIFEGEESVYCPSHVSFRHSVDKHKRSDSQPRFTTGLLCSCLPSCGETGCLMHDCVSKSLFENLGL